MASLKSDKDGFLVGRGGKDALEIIIENTEKILQKVSVSGTSQKAVSIKPLKVKVAYEIPKLKETVTYTGRQKQTAAPVPATPVKVHEVSARTRRRSTQTEQIRDEKGRFIGRNQGAPVIQESRRARKEALKERKKQTKLLDTLTRRSQKNGLGGFMLFSLLMPLLGLIGKLVKLPISLPLSLGKSIGSRLLPGLFGSKGMKGGGFLKGGKWGRRLVKGGLFGAAMSLFSAGEVEASNMSRGQKNKAHVKNGLSGVGGLGGAAAGAALGASLGSVVPVIGTAVGGVLGAVLGGFSGSVLTEQFVDWLDGLIDPALSNRMFSSWDGFTEGAGTLWKKLTKEVSAQSRNMWLKFGAPIAPYWAFLKEVGGDAWKLFSDAVKPFWDGLSSYAQSAFDAVKNSWVGEKVAEAKDVVVETTQTVVEKSKTVIEKAGEHVREAKEKVKETVKKPIVKGAEYVRDKWQEAKETVEKNVPNHKEGLTKKMNHALSFDGGIIKGMTDTETRAFAANVAETESGFKHKIQNKHGYTGLYQFGAEALVDIGYMKADKYKAARAQAKKLGRNWDSTNAKGKAAQIDFMNDSSNWTIEGGLEAYRNSRTLQNKSFALLANKNIQYGARAKHKLFTGEHVAKYLKMAHLRGASAAAEGMLNSGYDRKDGNGTSMQSYGNGAAKDLKSFSIKVENAIGQLEKNNQKPVVAEVGAAEKENKSVRSLTLNLDYGVSVGKIQVPNSAFNIPKVMTLKLPLIPAPILASKNIETDKPIGYRSDNLSQTPTYLPHRPISRRVEHEYIAWTASGGLGMG